LFCFFLKKKKKCTSSVVSFIGAGTCTVLGNNAGNANYNAAIQASQSFAVGKGTQFISFVTSSPASAVVNGATYTPSATSSVGLTVGITVSLRKKKKRKHV
jgi:hypothetical protein